MSKESGYYGTKEDHERDNNVPVGATIVRKSAGWINSKERFIWVVYLVGKGKRIYIRGYSESLDPKALENAKVDAAEIVEVVGGIVLFRKMDGLKDEWCFLATP